MIFFKIFSKEFYKKDKNFLFSGKIEQTNAYFLRKQAIIQKKVVGLTTQFKK
jgi:hypothetical protein